MFPILWFALYDYEHERLPKATITEYEKKQIERSRKALDKEDNGIYKDKGIFDKANRQKLDEFEKQKTITPWKYFLLNPHLYKIGLNNECFT